MKNSSRTQFTISVIRFGGTRTERFMIGSDYIALFSNVYALIYEIMSTENTKQKHDI